MLSIPYFGSKRNWYNSLNLKYKRIHEPFGGSAVLSVNALNDNKCDEIFVNDYDSYLSRLNEITETKRRIFKRLEQAGITKSKTLLTDNKARLLQDIVTDEMNDPRLVRFLCDNFVFSARRARLSDNNIKSSLRDFEYFMNNTKLTNYDEYIKILERDCVHLFHEDFTGFLKRIPDTADDLVIIDPPYISTENRMYNTGLTFDKHFNLVTWCTTRKNPIYFFCDKASQVQQVFDGLKTLIRVAEKKSKLAGANARHRTEQVLIINGV